MEEYSLPFLLLFGALNVALFIAGYLGKISKFPSIIFYIFSGIFLGQFVHQEKAIEQFSEIGIVLLFFYLGLEFTIERGIETAKKIWIVGILDFVFGFLTVFLVMLLLGFDLLVSLIAGGVAYASSSAITTKIIIDNHRIANPETEIILGLMVFEDLIAPIILAIIAGMSTGHNFSIYSLGFILLKIVLVFIFVGVVAYFFRGYLSKFIDQFLEEDIFTLFSLGSMILFAGITQYIGLSEALGAFLMGVIIAETGKSHEVERAMYSIRDLAVAIFFFIFGASIQFSFNIDQKLILALVVVIILSIVGKFLTGFIGGMIYGLSKKASMVTGLSIINRGEFSIVMSKYAQPNLIPVIGMYVLTMAILGIITAQFAPWISKKILPKKKKKKEVPHYLKD